LRQVEAQRAVAALNLAHATLTAPVDGIVAARNIDVGDLPSAASPAFVIFEDGALEVSAQVVETALATMSVGDPARLLVSGLPEIAGEVRLIAPTVDATTRLGQVRITPAPTEGLRAGLYVGGWIVTDTHSGLGVPSTAVLSDSTGNFVFVVIDGTLHRTAVVAGPIWEGQREILEGVSEGDVVVARAGGFFSDGDRVTPVGAEIRP
jgi:RND family efflux transporter MFP subunit